MNKAEIIKRLMMRENWETMYIHYAEVGLKTEKKEKLLELLKETGDD